MLTVGGHQISLLAKRARAFISYRRETDQGTVAALYRGLVDVFGTESVFFDQEEVKGGERWPSRLKDELDRATVVLVVIGPKWLTLAGADGVRRLDEPEDWVRQEIAHALQQCPNVIPVLLDSAVMPERRAFRTVLDVEGLVDRQALKLVTGDWKPHFEGITKRLVDHGFKKRQDPHANSESPEHSVEPLPYAAPRVGRPPALETEVLTARFVGRERLLEDLSDALRGLQARAAGKETRGAAKVQAIWYDGFGGMGKSWFLRRAILQTRELVPTAKVALIDWDQAAWRVPLTQPPERVSDVLEAIAYRVAQIYSTEQLGPYWHVCARIETAAPRARRLRERFQQNLTEELDGKGSDATLRLLLAKSDLLLEGAAAEKNKRALKQDRPLQDHLFKEWVEHGAGSVDDDPDLILRPDAKRLGALRDCMRLATSAAPLVLVLDTCEVVPNDLERWLRELIAPLCDGTTPFLALMGSRAAPDIAESPGSRDVWRTAVQEERWRNVHFDEGVRFTVEEISRALERAKPPVQNREERAQRLHRITLGVPLALRSLIDLHESGSPVLEELNDLAEPDGDERERAAEEQVVEIVAARFLLHLQHRREREQDLHDVIALALLHQANPVLLASLWQVKPGQVKARLRELSMRYSLLARGDLHQTVRNFLRRRWRSDDRHAMVDRVIEELQAAVAATALPGEPGESEHMEALAERLNATAWQLGSSAAKVFAPAISLALAFDQNVPLIVNLAAELPRLPADVSRGIKVLAEELQDSPWAVEPWRNDDVVLWLEREESAGEWTSMEKASLDLLRGLRHAFSGRHQKALRPLLSALEVFANRDTARRARFGEALFNVGYTLHDDKRAAEDAIAAYAGARRLEYSTGAASSNIGLLCKAQGRDAEAEAAFAQAMADEPKEPLYPRNLGDLFRQRKRYDEAERWYREALDVQADYPAAHNGLALMYQALERDAEAEAAFARAIAAAPKEPLYPRNLGDLFQARERYDEAERWYRKALEIQADYPDAHNGLALMYKELERDAEAEAAFARAIAAAPKDPLYPRNLGDLFRERKRNDEAERWYRKALEIQADYPAAHYGLALMYEQLERDAEAEAAFAQAMAADPKERLIPRSLGDLLRERKRYDEAERCIARRWRSRPIIPPRTTGWR